jgi:hypothetical protein
VFEPLVGLLNRGYAVSRSEPSANMGAAGPVGNPAPEVMGLRSNPCVVPVAQGADGPSTRDTTSSPADSPNGNLMMGSNEIHRGPSASASNYSATFYEDEASRIGQLVDAEILEGLVVR